MKLFEELSMVRRALKAVRRTFEVIWCVIAARSRYGIGRDDDESKLA